MPPLLAVEGLEAGYGPINVLHGVSLAVEPGEIVAMIGANGAGKTTTLMCLSGCNRDSTGTPESAQRTLMRVLATTGNYAAVLQFYRELRLRLHHDLNTEPWRSTWRSWPTTSRRRGAERGRRKASSTRRSRLISTTGRGGSPSLGEG